MKCQLTARIQVSLGHPKLAYGDWMPVGYIHEEKDAFKLVMGGCAIPADEECRIAAGMTDEKMKKAQKHYGAVAKGIHPDDYPAFFAGEMTGYDGKGRKVPGPNASEEHAEEYAELAEDEQDEEDFDDE